MSPGGSVSMHDPAEGRRSVYTSAYHDFVIVSRLQKLFPHSKNDLN